MSRAIERTPDDVIAGLRRDIDILTQRYDEGRACLLIELAEQQARNAKLSGELMLLKHLFGVTTADELPPQDGFWGRTAAKLLRKLSDTKKQRDELREAATELLLSSPSATDLRLLLLMSRATQKTRPELFDGVDCYEAARAALTNLLETLHD